MDTASADSESKGPPAPKVPPKALPRRPRSVTSRLPSGACREASSSDEDTPSVKAHSPRAQAPTPKPRKGKKAASPVPAPEMDNPAGAPPDKHARKPEQPLPHKAAKEDPVHACAVSVSLPVSVVVLVPVFLPSILFALARVGSLGPRHLALVSGP
ncbi:hypothetical protein P4O66_009703 [Electrophorus voltai]|uniref:Uncharacterized protein n=1 Tax=Electrophorus voltai TaxID=2609070 RepID=A0AAD9DZ92_9TELE|nr:hypothetical protein P4O66_009703 [Electrophorus voltai]